MVAGEGRAAIRSAKVRGATGEVEVFGISGRMIGDPKKLNPLDDEGRVKSPGPVAANLRFVIEVAGLLPVVELLPAAGMVLAI